MALRCLADVACCHVFRCWFHCLGSVYRGVWRFHHGVMALHGTTRAQSIGTSWENGFGFSWRAIFLVPNSTCQVLVHEVCFHHAVVMRGDVFLETRWSNSWWFDCYNFRAFQFFLGFQTSVSVLAAEQWCVCSLEKAVRLNSRVLTAATTASCFLLDVSTRNLCAQVPTSSSLQLIRSNSCYYLATMASLPSSSSVVRLQPSSNFHLFSAAHCGYVPAAQWSRVRATQLSVICAVGECAGRRRLCPAPNNLPAVAIHDLDAFRFHGRLVF